MPTDYDFFVTLWKAARAFALAGLMVMLASLANWLTDGVVMASVLSHLPSWSMAIVLPALHAAGVALDNWLKHRNRGDGGEVTVDTSKLGN